MTKKITPLSKSEKVKLDKLISEYFSNYRNLGQSKDDPKHKSQIHAINYAIGKKVISIQHISPERPGDKPAFTYFVVVTAKKLWDRLGTVPVNDDGDIEEEFLIPELNTKFIIGTDPIEIWSWFEETFNLSLAKDLIYSK